MCVDYSEPSVLCLEKRVGRRIPARHPLSAWVLEHAAFLLNAMMRGNDGVTPWARARGRDFGMKLYALGACVLWKQPPKGPQHDAEGNMGPRLMHGPDNGHTMESASEKGSRDGPHGGAGRQARKGGRRSTDGQEPQNHHEDCDRAWAHRRMPPVHTHTSQSRCGAVSCDDQLMAVVICGLDQNLQDVSS